MVSSRHYAILTLLVVISANLRAQTPNGSFENRQTTGLINPDGWDSFNAVSASNGIYTCEKGTSGAPHGNSFLMLTTKAIRSNTLPAFAVLGVYDFAAKQPKHGVPYTGRPQSLTGKWQYLTYPPFEVGRIAVYLTRWNTNTNQRDKIGIAEHDLHDTVTSWTSFSIPITYLSGETPDSVIITMAPSHGYAVVGSYLYIDSLNFAGHVTGVRTVNDTHYNLKLYPNPVKETLFVDFGTVTTDDTKLWLMDTYGRVISQVHWHAGRQVYKMPLGAVAKGTYFLKLQAGNTIRTQRLVVE